MAALHLVGVWALLQIAPVRQAVGEVMPILVDLVAPPAPPQPQVAPPPPPPKPVVPPPKPRPVVTVKPKPAPVPPVFVAPPPPPEPVAVTQPDPGPPQPEAPPQPVVAAAPVAPAPPPPPAPPPKTVSISAVSYLKPPVLHYPNISLRMQEEGRVHVRVLVDAQGLPREMQVVRSSGYARLDESALATVRATRFKPYTENGVAQPFWVVMPLIFEMES
ncbi:MAG: energy transducer TonB [Burkholderiaceae bacterium]|nr:energy transducer TonB [Burkholderiaceae bacterium]